MSNQRLLPSRRCMLISRWNMELGVEVEVERGVEVDLEVEVELE